MSESESESIVIILILALFFFLCIRGFGEDDGVLLKAVAFNFGVVVFTSPV